jgi:hypothetical protein
LKIFLSNTVKYEIPATEKYKTNPKRMVMKSILAACRTKLALNIDVSLVKEFNGKNRPSFPYTSLASWYLLICPKTVFKVVWSGFGKFGDLIELELAL